MKGSLVVIQTHPIQYHVPVYRTLQAQWDIPVTAIYGSDFSVVGYRDKEFGVSFAWDVDLLSGYTAVFLSRVETEGARSVEDVSSRGLRRALREISPRAALIVGYSPRFYWEAFSEAWRIKIPVLFRGETTDHAKHPGLLRAWFRDPILRWIYKRCDRLLYVGQRSYRHFKRLGVSDQKLISSPYCVDTVPFEPSETNRTRLRQTIRQMFRLTKDQKVLLFSGKLSRRKGVELILPAIRALPDNVREQIVLFFIGDGALRQTLRKQAEGPPSVSVHFLGFQNQKVLSPYYHAADLLLLPSLHSETWGLVVNEAFHHGLPCVVSEEVGCALDLVEPGITGEICRAGQVLALSLAIERAMGLIGRSEIRERCRRKVSGYTVEKAAEGIAQAYWAVAA